MSPYHSEIREAYRAALLDCAIKEIDGRNSKKSLLDQTASLASIATGELITEEQVVNVIKLIS